MSFGNFYEICQKTPLPLCNVLLPNHGTNFKGIISTCYARSISVTNTMIFQVGNCFIHISAIVVLMIIVFHVRSKYTAIGRIEMLFFFYLYIANTIASLVVDAGVSPPSSATYGYFVAVQIGLASACCWSLMLNGFLGFQFWEDGTRKSINFTRLIALCAFSLNFILSLFTFHNWSSNSIVDNTNTLALFVTMYFLNAVTIGIYVLSQIILILTILKNWWALGAIMLGCFFFTAAQVLMYRFSNQICEGVNHYLDGLFFGTLCNLFAVMMLYKYWDMITTEDLEFSVSNTDGAVPWTNGFFDEKDNREPSSAIG
ncbi:Chs7p [Komagataella phaffii]|nr:GQ67_02175T0 [Komagataella phaffii]AOA65597.1 GQ68_02190T0 [Komagataella phaffii GS115]CAH2446654.1 Hypothetical protein BQ9382_C1-4125 [Komagataella phaffii CBS 7435]